MLGLFIDSANQIAFFACHKTWSTPINDYLPMPLVYKSFRLGLKMYHEQINVHELLGTVSMFQVHVICTFLLGVLVSFTPKSAPDLALIFTNILIHL